MRWVRVLLRTVTSLGLLVAVALLAALVVVPRACGWVPLTVLSGSMTPTYPVGSQVVVERVDGAEEANDLEVGDIITFLPRPDDPSLTTHRIVRKQWRQDGVAVFTTRGDANGTDDAWELTEQQIRGRARYHVPYAGYVATALTQEKKDTGIVVLAGGLLGYAAWQLAQTALRRRSRTRVRGTRANRSAGRL